MAGEWRSSTWGEEVSLEYGKALRGYDGANGEYRVFGSNGSVGWTTQPLAPGPGVILGRKGAYRGVQYSPDPFYVIDTAYYVVPKTELDMRWLYYAITHYKLGEVDDGSPIPSTTRAAVYMLDLEVPPPDEQRAIAHILGTLDDKIEMNRRMNETLEAMARALFKSWFVDFDPVRAKHVLSKVEGAEGRDPGLPKHLADLFPDSFEDSELGEIPKGWEVRTLYDCADYINGSAFRNDDFSPERVGLPVIKIGELKDGITSQTKFIETTLEPKYRITSGDILFSWSGSPDTSIDTFVWTGGDGWLNQHIFKMQFNRPEEKFFVHFLLRHLKPVFIEIARNKQTTGLGHVTAQDLKRLKTVFPPDDILRAFNRLAEPLFQKAYSNSGESCALAAIRDTLLPKLISGELRIDAAERFIKESTI
jgi:type I restriction enzyme S subunit